MNNNRATIYHGIAGLHCECGNSESMVATGKEKYDTFYYAWSTRTGSGKAVVYCRKCASELHDVQVSHAPPDIHVALLAKFGTMPEDQVR